MTPNGRRAWRRWVKRSRARMKYKQPLRSNARMAREARRHLDHRDHIVLASPLFTAHSLVGMSEATKKRLREAIFCGSRAPAFTSGAVSITAALRIGERLRPCPGCMECDPSGFASICDGSGVLPAGRSKTCPPANYSV